MPFLRPLLTELVDRVSADIETRLPTVDARLRRSFLGEMSRIQAGVAHGFYGYLDWLAKQLMPDTAEIEHLDRWSTIWGVNRKAATGATGNVTFTGTNGTSIPAGTQLQRSDGTLFSTNAIGTISAGSALIAVTAVVAGQSGNTLVNTKLTLLSPIPGINSSATVAAGGLTGGADIETDDALRERLLTRIRQQPHGGADFDYETWALEVAGVTRAWVGANEMGVGTVVLRFVRDNDVSIIPDAAEVTAVQTYVDALRPVTVGLTVVAPIAVTMNFTISGLSPSTQAVQDAIESELTDLLAREASPGGTILISHIREAVSIAAGEVDHVLTVPSANVTHATGEIPVMGTVTYV